MHCLGGILFLNIAKNSLLNLFDYLKKKPFQRHSVEKTRADTQGLNFIFVIW